MTAVRERDFSDSLAMKRSYHAMEILCGTAPANVKILQEKFYVIVTTLFDIFLPNSNGNMNHFGKIFETLLRRHPGPILDMVVIEGKATRLMDQMLPYIYESSVQGAMLGLLFFPTVQHDMKVKRQECYSRLQEMEFLEKVLAFLEFKELPMFVTAASEFLIRMIEDASRTEDSDILFKSLEMQQGADIVGRIVELAATGTDKQREAAISVLNGFLVKSNAPPFRSLMGSSIYSDMPTPVSPLYSVSTSVQELLHPHLQRLCDMLIVEKGGTAAGDAIPSYVLHY
ncbi:hypothetical protein BC938DRAFT_470531 [Jimgerdemannia flammicorona]|uniref:Uncharacterized protein n=1 Tax=Jimgerdemannia flammicorona TaxID=994334 RepID=A0A433QA52_9FUNG|nr:hypothetical protein BC938DRAFT_470531 [Jimgerdemannia flammicorona]